MRRILNRNQFLKYSLNEALANDVNWGDSLLGRLINSTIRKAGIGINLRKMDNVIKRLQEEFERLVDLIQVKNDESVEFITFYLLISALLGKLIEEIEDDSNSISDLIKSVEGIIYEITYDIEAPNEETKKEKELVLKKLEEYKEFLKSYVENLEDKEVGDKEVGDKEVGDKEVGDEEVGDKEVKKLELPPYNEIEPKSLKSETSPEKIIQLPEYKKYLAIDLTKEELKSFPSIIEEINKTISLIGNSIIKINEVDNKKSKNVDNIEIKKLINQITLYVHPDRTEYTGLSKEFADELFKKFQKLVELNDIEGIKEFSKYLEGIKKLNQKKKEAYDIVNSQNKNILALTSGKKELSSRQKNFKKDTTEELKKKLKNPIFSEYKDEIESIITSREGKRKINDSLIVSYYTFINENKDLSVEKLRGKFDEIFDEDFMKKYQVTKSPEELEKEIKSDKKTISIDPIIEIVKIFNRAYKLHTPGMIPSGRKSGKVSNTTFREYDYVGKGSDSARPASDGGVEPSVGPYRNKSIFNKWESAVQDIIKNPKYQQIFNEDTYFQFKPSDPRYNKEKSGKQGGGKSLLKFMNEMLDGSELYREGAQSKFIKEYFDVEVDGNKLGFKLNGKNDKDEVEKTADKTKDKLSLTFKPYSRQIKNAYESVGAYFKMIDKDTKREWYFKIIEEKDYVVYFIMTLDYPFNLEIENKSDKFNKDNNLYIGFSSFKEFEEGRINDKKLIISEDKDKKVDELEKDDRRKDYSEKIEVLVNKKGEIYKDKEKLNLNKELSDKSNYIVKNKEDIIDKLKKL